MSVTILVPRGAEERAVRRAAPHASIAPVAAGAAAAVPAGLAPGNLIVVVGLCGALTDARVGDVVVYERIAYGDGAEVLNADDAANMRRAFPAARAVTACTTDGVVTRAVDRMALAAHFSAEVVDMEGLLLARSLRARALRYAMVRVVSDDPRADLPPIEDALDASGAIRPFALASAFARAPFAAARFVRDVQASLRVLGAVGATLGALK